jgi:hypothetical protein
MQITFKTPKVPFPVPHDLADDIRVSIKITFFNFKLGVLIATAFKKNRLHQTLIRNRESRR